jgi:putative SbcD/Mre11-related phosphoesterase
VNPEHPPPSATSLPPGESSRSGTEESTQTGTPVDSSQRWNGCLAVDELWLVPELGAVHPQLRAAVIADVHLGYEWARAAAGDCVPRHSLHETLERLERLVGRFAIDHLIIAGDLLEPTRPCRRSRRDLELLGRWLAERRISLTVSIGNHDQTLGHHAARLALGNLATLTDRARLGRWTIVHGHRPASAQRVISGHLHPALRLPRMTAPCFLVSPQRIILPAFSPNASGCDLAGQLPGEIQGFPLRCVASTGFELLDLGPLETLGSRIRATTGLGSGRP